MSLLRYSILILVSSLLGACANMNHLAPGTPLSEVQQQFGKPSIACPTNNPTRFVWSMQPMGQYAWAVDIDQNQQVVASEQILTDSAFAKLDNNDWTQEQVLCYFGPPADRDITPYKGIKMRVWSYRYRQQKAWDSMMYVYFGDDGLVKHHHPGPDPLSARDGMFFIP